MIFLDLFGIVFFILLAPLPILSGIFQYNPRWFRRFGNWNYVGVLNFYFITTIITLNYLDGIILLRRPPTHLLIVAGSSILFIGCIISYIAGRTLTLKTLISLPQIHPNRYHQTLVTNGLYRKMRHPRYIGYWLIALGFSMTTGLLFLWLFFIWLVVGLSILALLEERELRQRFGKTYTDYMQRVPAFLPKLF